MGEAGGVPSSTSSDSRCLHSEYTALVGESVFVASFSVSHFNQFRWQQRQMVCAVVPFVASVLC